MRVLEADSLKSRIMQAPSAATINIMKTSKAILAARQQLQDPSDPARVESIELSGMLDRACAELDELTEEARNIMGTENAAITIVLGVEQRMLSTAGLEPVTIPREISFCTHVVASAKPLMVNDAIRDPFFSGHPLVAVEGSVRSYCGVPITTPDGEVAGALCAIDSRERTFTPEQLLALSRLAQRAREIMIPGVAREEVMAPALWFREDPLAAWILENVPTQQQLDDARGRGFLGWLHSHHMLGHTPSED